MNSQLFIPEKCKVGFNIREDCYTKRLGYVIAFDGKKWRKEPSWESWREKVGENRRGGDWVNGKYTHYKGILGEEVEPFEFENKPTAGFVLNKKVGGYKSDWNMRQTYARVYDPRGFEIEINIVNLLYILEVCNCMKGKGLEGDFVYSWDGKDLVLLPCLSWEYEKAAAYTSLQHQKISAKDLIPGASYRTKKEEDIVYVGRYLWHEFDLYGRGHFKEPSLTREAKKYHIFTEDNGKSFVTKSNVEFLAQQNSPDPVNNYSDIMEKFQNNTHSSIIVKFETVPCKIDFSVKHPPYGSGEVLKKTKYWHIKDNILTGYTLQLITSRDKEDNQKWNHLGYKYSIDESIDILEHKYIDKGNYSYNYRQRIMYSSGPEKDRDFYHWGGSNSHTRDIPFTEEQISELNFCDLYVTFENGKIIKINENNRNLNDI